MISNVTPYPMRTLLSFCYLFILILSISCGGVSQKQEAEKTIRTDSAPAVKVESADTGVILFLETV